MMPAALFVAAAGAGLFAPPPTQQACNALMAGQAWLEAARCIDAIQAAAPAPINLMRAAQLYGHTGRVDEAIERYEAYLATGETTYVDKARTELSALRPRARGRVDVRCEHPSARVLLDSVDIGGCPLVSDWLRPGERRLVLVVEGRVMRSEVVTVTLGQSVPALEPVAAVPSEPVPIKPMAARITADDDIVWWAQRSTVGVGLIGLGIGAWFHAENVRLGDAFQSQLGNDALADEVDAALYASVAGFAIGASAALGGLIWICLDDASAGTLGARPGGATWSITW